MYLGGLSQGGVASPSCCLLGLPRNGASGDGRGRWGRPAGAPLAAGRKGEGRGREGRKGPARSAPPPAPAAPPRFAMVEHGDAAPLLSWAEGPAVSPPQGPELQAGGWVRGGGGGARPAAEPSRRREPGGPAPPEVLLQPGRLELSDVEEDQVVAVFVVTFDPRSGEPWRDRGLERSGHSRA